MQEFLNWTISAIQNDKLISSWIEERKYEWTPIVAKFINNVINSNNSVIIMTDDDRDWFLEYILTIINQKKLDRPFLPFYNIRSFYKKFDSLKSKEDTNLIKDMLDISFPSGYIFWYIGKGDNVKAIIPKTSDNSFLWLLDDSYQNAFTLNSNDEAIDIKLIQMFRLLNKTISAVLFSQINVEH